MGFTYERGYGLADLVDDVEDGLNATAHRIAHRCEQRFLELVVDFTPVSDDPFREFPGRLPGTLKRSWESESEVYSDEFIRVAVETHDPVAPHVEYDTAPHIIRPRPERAAAAAAEGRVAMLRFYNELGQVIFAHEVHHPGTTGQHMMQRALNRMVVEWRVIAREEMIAWARGKTRDLSASRLALAGRLRGELRT